MGGNTTPQRWVNKNFTITKDKTMEVRVGLGTLIIIIMIAITMGATMVVRGTQTEAQAVTEGTEVDQTEEVFHQGDG